MPNENLGKKSPNEPRSAPSRLRVAVVGAGPAGLMAADVLGVRGVDVTLVEQRPQLGWRLFVAGGSGLNISSSADLEEICTILGGEPIHRHILTRFGVAEWLGFVEKNLELATFLGTSRRFFAESMHAGLLVRRWRKRLDHLGVRAVTGAALTSLQRLGRDQRAGGADRTSSWCVGLTDGTSLSVDAVVLALGGGSWLVDGFPAAWPTVLSELGVVSVPFSAANVGWEVAWSEAFLCEAEGRPLNGISLTTALGTRRGELMVTNYGLEGTPVYALGSPGRAFLDLAPDLTSTELEARLGATRGDRSLLRTAQRFLGKNTARAALLYHQSDMKACASPAEAARLMKALPVDLLQARPLAEAISSRGGVDWGEIDDGLMLRRCPGVYVAGEMIDWSAPTGGFLVQICVSQGYFAARALCERHLCV